MSRWGALFASLSPEDTNDKTPSGAPAAPLFVDCVDCVCREEGGGGDVPAAPPATPWLARLARAIAAAVADGAEQEADPDGWLLLIRPSGRRLAVAPHVVAELTAAGLLPANGRRSVERDPLLPGTWT